MSSTGPRLYIILGLINLGFLLFFCSLRGPNPKSVQPGAKPDDSFYGDFRVYYAAGGAARISPERIYKYGDQIEDQKLLFPRSAFLPFYHPPIELPLFALLSFFPFAVAVSAWRLLSLAFGVGAGIALSASTGMRRSQAVLMVLALCSTCICIHWAQDGLLTLLLAAICFYLLSNGRDMHAGLILAFVALYKPQLPLVLAIALLAIGRTRFFVSFLTSVCAFAAACAAYLGRSGIRDLIDCAEKAEANVPPFMANLRELEIRMIGDHRTAMTIVAVAAVLAFVPIWRRSGSLSFTVSSAVCLACLVSPHLYAYDLTVLAIPMALLIQSPRGLNRGLVILLCSAELFYISLMFSATWFLTVPTLLLLISCFQFRTAPKWNPTCKASYT